MSSFLDNCSSYLFRNKHILFLIFLLPPLLWLGIIYLGSLLVFLFHSLFYLDGFTGKIVYKISLSTITELFTSAANIDILIRTVVLAACVSIGAALIGFPIAYYMAKFTSPKMKIFFYLAIMLPLWSSYLVRVYSWKLILAKEGIINWFFTKLHLNWLTRSSFIYSCNWRTISINFLYWNVLSFYLYLASIYDFTYSSFVRESSKFFNKC